MATTAQDTDQITEIIDLYIDGNRYGDAEKLRAAFHPETRMWGSLAGQRFDWPIGELIASVDGKPVDVEGSYHARITSLEQSDDIAHVTLEEEGFWGSVSFIDFFVLSRIDGAWKIVNKSFVHTGGVPPSAPD